MTKTDFKEIVISLNSMSIDQLSDLRAQIDTVQEQKHQRKLSRVTIESITPWLNVRNGRLNGFVFSKGSDRYVVKPYSATQPFKYVITKNGKKLPNSINPWSLDLQALKRAIAYGNF
jgi:hypothetical protein